MKSKSYSAFLLTSLPQGLNFFKQMESCQMNSKSILKGTKSQKENEARDLDEAAGAGVFFHIHEMIMNKYEYQHMGTSVSFSIS